MRRKTEQKRAFSLVEVAVAVGVFSISIVAVLALLIPTTRSASDVADGLVAARIAEVVNVELSRIGFDTIETATAGSTGDAIWLVADRKGMIIRRTGQLNSPPQIFDAEAGLSAGADSGLGRWDRFFLIKVSRLTMNSSDSLFFSDGKGFIALKVEVSWPYLVPIGPLISGVAEWNSALIPVAETPRAKRSFLYVTAAITR